MSTFVTLVFLFFVAPICTTIIVLLVLRSRTINMNDQLTSIQQELKKQQSLLSGITAYPSGAAVNSVKEIPPKQHTSSRSSPGEIMTEIGAAMIEGEPRAYHFHPALTEIIKSQATATCASACEAGLTKTPAVIPPPPPLIDHTEFVPAPVEAANAVKLAHPQEIKAAAQKVEKDTSHQPPAGFEPSEEEIITTALRRLEKNGETSLGSQLNPSPAQEYSEPLNRNGSPLPTAVISTEEYFLKTINTFLIKEGRIWVISGLSVLFLGAVFGVRYTIGLGLLSPQARVAGTCAFGLALLLAGLRFRVQKTYWAMVVQGGGLGIIYLGIVASVRLYSLVGQGSALFFMSLVVVITALLSIWQNSQMVAHLSILAAFAAPILVSTSDGNHISLFSFYLVLNVGILGMSLIRPWRKLYITGFSLSFGIFAFWVINHYSADVFSSSFTFLTVFYLFYVFLGVKAAVDYDGPEKKLIRTDLTLSILTPLIYLRLTLSLNPGNQLLALVSASVGLLSLLLGLRAGVRHSLTGSIFQCQAIIYLNLALAVFLLDLNLKTLDTKIFLSLLWAMEGAALYHHGLHNNKVENRFFGQISLIGAASLSLRGLGNVDQFLLAQIFIGSSLLYMAWSRLSWEAETDCIRPGPSEEIGDALPLRAIYLGPFSWLAGTATKALELWQTIDATYALKWLMLAWSLMSLALWLFQRLVPLFSEARLSGGYPVLNIFQKAPMAPALLTAFPAIVSVLGAAHFICPFTVWDIILWVLFLAIQMTTMFNDTGYESDKLYINLIALLLPVIVGAFICAAIVFRAGLSIQQEQWWYALLSAKAGAPVFGNLGLESAILVPFLLALSALIFALKNDYLEDSDYFVPAGLAMLCVVFFRFVILGAYASRSIAFLPYLPILNLVDILQITALSLSFIYLKQQFEPQGGPAQIAVYFFSFLFFLLLNLIIGRLVHHWGKVGFNIRDLWASDSFQASCAVFWAICGIAAMIRGHKTANRLLWLFGATLMAADLAKIFFVDLSRADALARIISFVAVGLVLILVGYFAPIPPGKYETAEEIR